MQGPPPAQPEKQDSDAFGTETNCVVTATRISEYEITLNVSLTGQVTIPTFAAREFLKGHHFTVSDMLSDMLTPRWMAALKPDADRVTRDALTGTRSFDPTMTQTLR
jgi:hypothetical protein